MLKCCNDNITQLYEFLQCHIVCYQNIPVICDLEHEWVEMYYRWWPEETPLSR